MSSRAPQLVITTAPFVREGATTRRIMYEVAFALLPVLVASMVFFGITALLVFLACVIGACGTEWLIRSKREGAPAFGTLGDGSALLTGALLAFTLPPATPLWMAFLGGVVSIGLGKAIWGGLGRNLFNPALVGRAFLQAAFPLTMTTWTAPQAGFWAIQPSTFAPPLFRASTDVVSSATPLGLAKFQGEASELAPMLFGNVGGSLGETSALVLIAAGLFLLARRTFDWRLCVSTLVSTAVFSGLLYLVNSDHPDPLFMMLSGGLLFGAVFMTTDPVTSPLTKRGSWIYGIGVGFLVVLIRVFGGLPEAVMYAILLMNAAVPHIDRYTQPRRFGG